MSLTPSLTADDVCIFFRCGNDDFYNDTYYAMKRDDYHRALNSVDDGKPDHANAELLQYLRKNGARLCNPQDDIPAIVSHDRKGRIVSAYSTQIAHGWLDNAQLAQLVDKGIPQPSCEIVLSITA